MIKRLIGIALLSALGANAQAQGFYADLGLAGQQYSLGFAQPVGGSWRLRGEYATGLTWNPSAVDTNSVNLAGHFYNMAPKYPTASTYLGVGYGQVAADKGLGFFANVGVRLGAFTADVNTDPSGVNYYGSTFTQVDIDAQRQKLGESSSLLGLKYLPSVSLGLVYRY
jgi:hypothetical protein